MGAWAGQSKAIREEIGVKQRQRKEEVKKQALYEA
jgi:hypothetical protein